MNSASSPGTALELDAVFPADPGILAALLMNRLLLQPGDALFVPAGMMHAHLRGTGVGRTRTT